MKLEDINKYHSYLCFLCLILISLSNTLQRGVINSMYSFQSEDIGKQANPHYCISSCLADFTSDNFGIMVGDFYTVVYAFMVLFTGSVSDVFDRKLLLCGACFGWTACTYLSSFATNFH